MYEPAAERQREQESEAAATRARLALGVEELSARRTLATLHERGIIRPGGGRPFAGVVMFELHELAEWAAAWVPRPVAVTDGSCDACGKAGVRLVKEGELVDVSWSFAEVPSDCCPASMLVSIVANDASGATPTTVTVPFTGTTGATTIEYPNFLPPPDVAHAGAFMAQGA